MLKGTKVSATRLEAMEEFLKQTWKGAYPLAREKLIKVKPLSNTFKVQEVNEDETALQNAQSP